VNIWFHLVCRQGPHPLDDGADSGYGKQFRAGHVLHFVSGADALHPQSLPVFLSGNRLWLSSSFPTDFAQDTFRAMWGECRRQLRRYEKG